MSAEGRAIRILRLTISRSSPRLRLVVSFGPDFIAEASNASEAIAAIPYASSGLTLMDFANAGNERLDAGSLFAGNFQAESSC